MTKKVMKIVALLLAVVFVISLTGSVFATSGKTLENSKSDNVDQFNKVEFNDGGASGSVQKIIASIINMVQIIGIGVAIIMLVVLAIKYISAAPGDKADIKKHAVVYVVGAVVLFAASGILQIIKSFAGNIQGSDTTTPAAS